MKQWGLFVHKESLEMWRSYKWIWMPIVFIFIGVQQPLSLYYLPDIIHSVGNLPEGAVIELPTPSAQEVISASIGQYNTLGILTFVLTFMGMIAAERKNGSAGMILSKPVSRTAYILAKWCSTAALLLFSFFCGYLASWYYTGALFSYIPLIDFLQSFSLYSLWLLFILSIILFFNSFLKVPGAIAFFVFTIVILFSMLSSAIPEGFPWNPSLLSSYSGLLLMNDQIPSSFYGVLLLTVFLIFILVISSVSIFSKKELV